MPWSPDQEATLRRMWPDHTGAEIGERLGISRSAVLGKAQRMGLNKTPAEATDARRRGQRKVRKVPQRRPLPRKAVKRTGVTGGTGNIRPGFQAPKGRVCQYIAGDPHERITIGDAIFCGAPCVFGSSYCDEHEQLCHEPAPVERKGKPFTTSIRHNMGLVIG